MLSAAIESVIFGSKAFDILLGLLKLADAPFEASSVRSSDVVKFKAVCDRLSEPLLVTPECELELSSPSVY